MHKKWSRINTETFIERAIEVHGDKYDYSEVNFVSSKVKVIIKCKKCQNKWKLLPHNHLGGNGCKPCQYKKLPQNQKITHEEFVDLAIKKHGDKFEYIGEYKGNKKKIKIKCKKCNKSFLQRASSHLEGCGCKYCVYKKLPQNLPKSVLCFENECKKIHDNKYDYCGDYKGGRHKIKIFCKKHQKYFYQNACAHLNKKQGCPICNQSRGEFAIEDFLIKNKIKYTPQKKFKKCKCFYELPFDFYLSDYNVCVEYDGQHHFYSIDYFGGDERLKVVKKHDEIKTNFCIENNIDILRISYLEFNKIENILKEKLCI